MSTTIVESATLGWTSPSPRKRLKHLIADKRYSYSICRKLLRERGIKHTIAERCDQLQRRMEHPGRPLSFDLTPCARLKHWRGIAPRYEKQAVNYKAEAIITSLMIWAAL